MGKKKRSDYIILSKKIGFIIETNNVDVSCYQRRTEGLSHSWINELSRYHIPYFFITGRANSEPLEKEVQHTPSEIRIHRDFYPYHKQSPHVLYSIISNRMTRTKCVDHVLEVDLPPIPQYRSLIWWLSYYYLANLWNGGDVEYWIHVRSYTWVNLAKINQILAREREWCLLGQKVTKNMSKGGRPIFGPWYDSDRGLILSQKVIQTYLHPCHAIYIWTDLQPDKALSDVIRRFWEENYPESVFQEHRLLISADAPLDKKMDQSWIKQCCFITNLNDMKTFD